MRHRRRNIGLTLAALAGAAGCGGLPKTAPTPATRGPNVVPPPPATALDSILVLESSGSQPDDTALAIAGGRTRSVVIRREAPDFSLFARLTFTTPAGDSTRIAIKPRPGLYGFDLSVDRALVGGIGLTMSYAVHFVAPAGARERYGSDLEFERALFIARVDGARVEFLPSARTGSDVIDAVLPGPGRYLVAAPR